ncbi:hypothetical protein WJX84_003238 [Apatococcus fuscideae]|uniref:Glycosyltransferase subfamily 4-like N-terminal domain-containing protein n=1 Tax=Apatococcus fuscideae TaxID=2026836 RepID=A0AAW1T6D1_9CHLO
MDHRTRARVAMPVWVVVLGDFGRSPRMQNHTTSLAQQAGLDVHVLAYTTTSLPKSCQAPNITLHSLAPPPAWIAGLPRILALILKALIQAWALLANMLFRMPRPSLVLLQVPPAIPVMAVCWLACWRHRAALVLDWHNFGYTLMAMSMGRQHWLVRQAEGFERFWAKRATASLCVTQAMQRELALIWDVQATVFHDQPPAHFQRSTLEEQHALLSKLQPLLAEPMHPNDFCAASLRPKHALPHTVPENDADWLLVSRSECPGNHASPTVDGQIERREGAPALLVSSTSWTVDEDFRLLLDAALLYDREAGKEQASLPQVLVIVTGKGPQKEMYKERMRKLDLRHVAFRTAWLEPGDYPCLLGSADLGVCLHTSSSGLDLPMKVVDMFGCSLPACAVAYSCIGELVQDGILGEAAERARKHDKDRSRGALLHTWGQQSSASRPFESVLVSQ